MKKKIKFLVSSVLVMLVAFGGTLVSAHDWDYTSFSGTSSGSQIVNAAPGTPEACTLYGSVTVVGNDATWTSFLAGSYRDQCSASCSFGKNGSYNDIMGKKVFKIQNCYYYQETSGFFTTVNYATTRTSDY
ncbi:MAG: hypothetical protein K6E47_11040 [Lachnospiraceae bacterium]|nr:hypothetical protein [Lachnospiraceae bacterium]